MTSRPNHRYIGGQTLSEEHTLPSAGLFVIPWLQNQRKEKSKSIFRPLTSYYNGVANMPSSRFHMCVLANVTGLNDEPMLGEKCLPWNQSFRTAVFSPISLRPLFSSPHLFRFILTVLLVANLPPHNTTMGLGLRHSLSNSLGLSYLESHDKETARH